jgi:kynurenine formamidase
MRVICFSRIAPVSGWAGVDRKECNNLAVAGLMKNIDLNSIPAFHELPVRKGAPADSSWGVFGEEDALGCLNFLTPAGVVEAAALVREGKIFRLDAKIGFAKPPLYGRAAMVHSVVPLGPTANDDFLDSFNTQEGSQWDGLGHVGHFRHELFYNGVRVDETREGRNIRLGIHHWADKFVGRGVLIDVFGFRKTRGVAINPLTRETYTLEEIQGALEAQGTALGPGAILLIRTGWMESYEACSADEKQALAPMDKLASAGIEASRRMVEWLWNSKVAAVGTDCPAVEAFPFDFADDNALHYRALPLLGLPLGELFVLGPLAEDCAADGRYEFMVVSAPLNLEGGIASPPNAVAIK